MLEKKAFDNIFLYMRCFELTISAKEDDLSMDSSIREVTTSATLEEKKKLRKEFHFGDMLFFTIAALIGIDTLGAVSSSGGQVLPWLLISAATFFLPYGLLSAELGSTFTQEGGMYQWCKLAFGRFYASLGAMFYWISNPLWVGGSLAVTAIAAIKTFWFGNPNYFFGGTVGTGANVVAANPALNAAVEIVIALIFIWGTTWCAIMSLRFGKWLTVVGSYVKIALFLVFAVLALNFLLGGHATGTHLGLQDIIPSSNFGLVIGAILPALVFNWVGFELQNGAGEEMRNPRRDVPRTLIRAGIVTVLAYGLVISVILFTLPKDQLSNATGFLASISLVNSVLPSVVGTPLGWILALGIIIAVASSGGAWVIGADRTYAIASLDRTAPSFLGRFSGKYGTPIAVNTMSGIMGTIAMLAAILINSFGSSSIQGLFTLVLGFTISTTTLSYLFVFPAYLRLKHKYPHIHRPYSVPGGIVGGWLVSILPIVYVLMATVFVLYPPDAIVALSGVSRLTYELTQLVPLAIIIVLTVVFYVWGQLETRNTDVVVEVPLAETEMAAGD